MGSEDENGRITRRCKEVSERNEDQPWSMAQGHTSPRDEEKEKTEASVMIRAMIRMCV